MFIIMLNNTDKYLINANNNEEYIEMSTHN